MSLVNGLLNRFRLATFRPGPPPDTSARAGAPPFADLLAEANAIPGMMSDLSVRIFDALLSLQARRNIAGNMLEIGVFKGKSAAVLAAHARPGERLLLVDVEKQFSPETEAKHLDTAEFLLMPSGRFAAGFADYTALRRSCRFIHIDASHQYHDTLGELQIVEDLLADDGVAAFDDFLNLDYAQNMAAIFRHLFNGTTELGMFLVTAEKAYVCRRSALDLYGGFALESLVGEMRQRGHDGLLIARTDDFPGFRPICLRPRLPGEEGDRYGVNIYRRYYERF
jgi:predicted O-methyltransferase YrrM